MIPFWTVYRAHSHALAQHHFLTVSVRSGRFFEEYPSMLTETMICTPKHQTIVPSDTVSIDLFYAN